MTETAVVFDVPLVEGIIEKRKSQFTILVIVNGTEPLAIVQQQEGLAT